MKVASFQLDPPELSELAGVLEDILQKHFEMASVSVVDCPNLHDEPFNLAARGISGNERIADIGGQPNLFPTPILTARYSLMSIAAEMSMDQKPGMLIGAGAGPFFDVGVNNELAPNISWDFKRDGCERIVNNLTHYTQVLKDGTASRQMSPTANFALMMNLFGSDGVQGPVLKIAARENKGSHGLTDYIRFGLRDHYGSEKSISLGGVFLMKKGTAKFHVMPDFPPPEQMPFKSPKQLNDWLTWHNFEGPIVCLTVMHTSDPSGKDGGNLGLRMEHTHCFSTKTSNSGGHYHEDIHGGGIEDVEYEAYLNTAKLLYRIDQPDTVLERGLHD